MGLEDQTISVFSQLKDFRDDGLKGNPHTCHSTVTDQLLLYYPKKMYPQKVEPRPFLSTTTG